MHPTFSASLEADPLDVWNPEFIALCETHRLTKPAATATEAAISELFAARFVLGVLRENKFLRWRFPDALSAGVSGAFCSWICGRGARKYSLSAQATKKIRGAFRRRLGNRVRQVYLRDDALQRYCPTALLPIGQRAFFGWLVTFGRSDQDFRDEEILWFLHETTEELVSNIALTYLVQPGWQETFPNAADAKEWRGLTKALRQRHPCVFPRRLPGKPPKLLAHRSDAGNGGKLALGANILSHFCYPSGLQQAGIWIQRSLEACGVPTTARDVPAGIACELLDREPWLGLERYPISIFNVAPTPYFADAYERSGLLRRDGIHRIGCWAWELEVIPDDWLALAPLVDEIWAPTAFVARAMRSRMPLPVYDMLPGVEVSAYDLVTKEELGVPADHFVFFFMFDMYSEFERKNPLAIIEAFRRAFARTEKVSLVIKVSRGSADAANLARLRTAAEANGVCVIDAVVSREKAYGFLAMCDCFVSLHRSEGFGLALAEAMLLGKPVIATAYSGNLDFMHAGNSWLVDYGLTNIEVSGPIYRQGAFWAAPSVTHAADLMREVFENPESARARAAQGKAELEEKLSLRAAGERMIERMRAITHSRVG